MTERREIIPYTDEAAWLAERAKDITSTDCAALFNVSPYVSRFELWHRKVQGFVTAHPENDRQSWGKRLQDSIADGVAFDSGWAHLPFTDYIRLVEERIGSSFDYKIADEGPWGLLEVKNVDGLVFRQGWTETEFGVEAPVHIELQAQHQLLVSGLAVCYIAALVGGNRVHLLRREADEPTHARIIDECAAFWKGGEPEPDFHRDAAFIAKLYGYSQPGMVLDADDETAALFREYAGHRAIAKAADDNADAAKAAILRRIGNAERVNHPDFTLSAKTVKAAHIAYDRAEYRGFKLTERSKK